MLVGSAFKDLTFMFDTLAFTCGAVLVVNFTGFCFFFAHGVTFAFDWVAHLISVGADFIISAVIVISALDLDAGSILTEVFARSVSSCQTVIVVSTFDWFTFILITDEFSIWIGVEVTRGINFLPAVFVFTADLIFTLVSETSVSFTEVGFTIQVRSTFNINTFVSVFESAADLFVTAMFSVQTFNIDTLIIPTG